MGYISTNTAGDLSKSKIDSMITDSQLVMKKLLEKKIEYEMTKNNKKNKSNRVGPDNTIDMMRSKGSDIFVDEERHDFRNSKG